MKQTIEQLRAKEGHRYKLKTGLSACGEGFERGAEWEYNRPKWIRDRCPNTDRKILIRLKGINEKIYVGQFVDSKNTYIFDSGGGLSNDSRIEWCEIPK